MDLFDLKNDRAETKNLATVDAYTSHLTRLEAALEKWRQETGDP